VKILKRILKIVAALFIFGLLLRILLDPYLFAYVRFRLRGQQYYSNVVAACDDLIAQTHGEEKRLRRDDMESLPAILRDLKFEGGWARPTGVVLMNGGTWSGLVLYWVADHDDPTLWHLAIRDGESGAHDVFTKRK
jgi:hypothetical protein